MTDIIIGILATAFIIAIFVIGIIAVLYDLKEVKLPYNCQHCELLGICRRPESEGWKCYNGCLLMNDHTEKENERKD